MSDHVLAGQVRTVPDSEVEVPAGKKARLDVGMASAAKTKKEPKNSKRKSKHKKADLPEPCSPDDVLWHEIKSVLGADVVGKVIEGGVEYDSPFTFHQEVEVLVKSLSPGGDAVAVPTNEEQRKTPWVIIVPFALPGEVVRAKVYRNARMHSMADLVEVVTPNPEIRDNSRVQCRYFEKCGGCQYQMLSYDTQLSLKRDVIIKAYRNFSGLTDAAVPTVLPTIGSPLQYGYRTKITPHFEAAPKSLLKKKQNDKTDKDEVTEQPDWLKIGFNIVGTRRVLDIEECPISTPVINQALVAERAKIIKSAYTYKRGVSLILRDSLDPSIPLPPKSPAESTSDSTDVDNQLSEALTKHVCITSHTASIRESVGGFIFEYPASSFFQNNNSVLVPLTEYVKDAIFPPDSPSNPESPRPNPTHLVDTYCGSGLFAITLSPYFETISGIELSVDSIRSAQHNVSLNNTLRAIPSYSSIVSSLPAYASASAPSPSGSILSSPQPNITFRSGTASDIFSSVSSFPRTQSVIVIDPPRKGCDEEFIRQVVKFRPGVLVYVSCNVHTQARDVGMLLRMVEVAEKSDVEEGKEARGHYRLESLRGFDLFPQTAHVESVAVLRLV
ncbi:S-adenosyl-L-methionine-dependent methyltransferase [Macrolepiota fuliginosa MF-IS2]|uniref:S-adenosyl-L-methionine-dependent methyltransferase n=1 Tax=Macrolepiota fuliginosa MF-IS2 TaxID=1400762 RepID=A0A9P5WYW7_9AGAR|nr:S-adenosyl-L-methionine-dependent methyltransferase [Macrolepiota fuliginosa MF-IS2]